jgi:HSP20 family protein
MFYRYVNDFDRTLAAMAELHHAMDHAFDPRDEQSWDSFPKATLKNQGSELSLEVDLPGVGDKDIELSIHQETLTLKGETKSDAPDGYAAVRRERAPIKFQKTLALPCKIDPEKSSAILKNGVMTVKLAKVPEAGPRRIDIQTH